jgi:SAM-dependent methyltransferase
MTTDERHPEWAIDPEKPNVARIYDYVLGGKDNFTADREAAEQVMAALPHVAHSARANRRFLAKAVTLLAERGVRQFLDLGSGLPTRENVHEVAQRTAPDSKVVYVDHDPVVLAHARALLSDDERTTVIQADLRDPAAVIDHAEVRARFDFDEPVGLLMLAVLHFVPDDDEAFGVVARLRERLVPGSHVVISHGHAGTISGEVEDKVRGTYGKTAQGDVVGRTPEDLMRFFDGCELLPPGIVPVDEWDAGTDFFVPDLTEPGVLGGVAVVKP